MEVLLDKTQDHYNRHLPFVLYALPESGSVTALFQNSDKIYTTDQLSKNGFVFAPFVTGDILLIPEVESECQSHILSMSKNKLDYISPGTDASEKKNYKQLVERALKIISQGGASKIVTSRCKEITMRNFSLSNLIDRVFHLDPTAFRYVWYHPETGLWCGATPEVLLKTQGKEFSTMALAGTRKYEEKKTPKWTPKEINEQRWVAEAVSDSLQQVASIVKVSGIKNHKAGTLVHLRTDFNGILPRGTNSLALLARSLHPTPAVCGTPQGTAREFILNYENYDRAYYTGYLGPVDTNQGRSSLYVNLRCMRISRDSAYLYVGGGITDGSRPEAEWQETQNKLQTMLQVLAPML